MVITLDFPILRTFMVKLNLLCDAYLDVIPVSCTHWKKKEEKNWNKKLVLVFKYVISLVLREISDQITRQTAFG